MTMARSLMPDSKLAQWERRNQFLFNAKDLKLQHLYRSLDHLDRNKDVLTTYLNHRIKSLYDRVLSVVGIMTVDVSIQFYGFHDFISFPLSACFAVLYDTNIAQYS